MLGQAVSGLEVVLVLVYLMVVGYLGWLGYRRTKTTTDYLVAGRKAHPFIMAVSYGATFISTSAIVGFGGVAGMFGMSLLWLTFLNIFVGIFIAFVFLGGPARRIGHRLDAHTFPELLGRRYQSRFIQVLAGLIIFLFIPIYAAAVVIGGTEFIVKQFRLDDYNTALLVFSLIVAAYVISGGLKAVMYTDALQGTIMFVGMSVLLVWAYASLGGVQQAHQELSNISGDVFVGYKAIGHQGWTATPKFGWGGAEAGKPSPYDLWWIVFTTIVMGVGIGVLAQPQLVVRFMTVKSKRELNRAALVGGIFILVMTGVAFTVGALSNVYFKNHEVIKGVLLNTTEEKVILKKYRVVEKAATCRLMHIDTNVTGTADTFIVQEGVGAPFDKMMPKAQVVELPKDEQGRQWVEVRPNASAFLRAVTYDKAIGRFMFNSDSIIPTYVTSAMPKWFGTVFLLTLLAAAMSTMSSQFHAAGTSIGHDVYGTLSGRKQTIGVTRIGIIIGLVLAVAIGLKFRGDYFIARATSIFFGLCASAFLPAFLGGLFFRRMTKAAAIASMVVGFAVTTFWLVFVKATEADAIGLVYKFMDHKTNSILASAGGNWPNVDPLVIALPLSVLTAVLVSLFTKGPDKEHLDLCFRK